MPKRPHKIEILSEALIDAHSDLAMDVMGISSRLAVPLGWHYLLDLIWILRELEHPEPRAQEPPPTVLEVGGGMGLLQFLLADRGYSVISVDMRRRHPDRRFRACYDFRALAEAGEIDHPYLTHLGEDPAGPSKVKGVKQSLQKWIFGGAGNAATDRNRSLETRKGSPPRPTIRLYRCDARSMSALEDRSIDATVSLSALEHNEPEAITAIQREVERVTRPGGLCLHTMSGVRRGCEFHAPSHSYLMDDAELARIYGLESYDSNWSDWEPLETEFRRPRRLARWLAHTYFESAHNGMPWGVWHPQYLPVGLRKEL
ncbi:methyltransferase domain-containing protein [bacterium]|nr:methyltransferase domain-containing protein [bacterium]